MSLDFIKPQLATAVDYPTPRAGWIHEVKHDGYRTVLIIERRKARAYTRNGFDWTERYPGPTKAAAKLDCRSAIIDGEVIVQDEHGVSDFEALKSAIRWRPQSLILCAFDLLHLTDEDGAGLQGGDELPLDTLCRALGLPVILDQGFFVHVNERVRRHGQQGQVTIHVHGGIS